MKITNISLMAIAMVALLGVQCKNSKKSVDSNQPATAIQPNMGVQQSDLKPSKENSEPVAKQEPEMKVSEPHYPDSLFFRMDRTPCFGQCPIYTVNIYASGWAHLSGKRFFDYIGDFSTKFSESELIEIEKLAERYDYFSLDHVYDAPVSDLPSTTTIIQSEKHEYWVYNRMNAPENLRQFEREMETLIKEKQWKPSAKSSEKPKE